MALANPPGAGPAAVFNQPVFVLNENGLGNQNLRTVQVQNFLSLRTNFAQHQQILADMCTGSGKTGLGCLAPFALTQAMQFNPDALPNGGRVLWVCPTREARRVVMNSLRGHHNMPGRAFLNFHGVLMNVNGQAPHLPTVLELKDGMGLNPEQLYRRMMEHDITVTTAQFFTPLQRHQDMQFLTTQLGPIFDLLVFDECHYLPTTSWRRVWESFRGPHTRYLAMSGTPYRTDHTDIERTFDLPRYMLLDAMMEPEERRCIKDVCMMKLRPTAVELEWANQRRCKLSGEGEVLCSMAHFPDPLLLNLLRATANTLRMLRSERGRGECLPHKALGFVQNKAQALRIKQLADYYSAQLIALEEDGTNIPLRVEILDSEAEMGVQAYGHIMARWTRRDLHKGNTVDMVLQHNVLSESFDAVYVSVATMFRNTGTLTQMAQAVGRVVRRIGAAAAGLAGEQPDRLDNVAHVVLHEFSEMRQQFYELCVRQGNREVLTEPGNEEVNQAADALDPWPPAQVEGIPRPGNPVQPDPYNPDDAAATLNEQNAAATLHVRRMVLAPTWAYQVGLHNFLAPFHSNMPGWVVETQLAPNLLQPAAP